MRALVLLLLCACNSLLGLDPTTEVPPSPDGAVADAPHFPCDLSVAYPKPMTAIAGCVDYTTDASARVLAVATCNGKISSGTPSDTSLQPVIFDDPGGGMLDTARVLPAGDQMVVRSQTPANLSHPVGFFVFERGASGAWSPVYEITFPDVAIELGPTDMVTAPTAGKSGRRLVLSHHDGQVGRREYREYAEASDPAMGWTLKNVYEPADYNQLEIGDPFLSSEGLGLVFVTNPSTTFAQLWYAVRDDIREAFVSPKNLEMWNIGDEQTPFLSADCTRLSVSSHGNTLLSQP